MLQQSLGRVVGVIIFSIYCSCLGRNAQLVSLRPLVEGLFFIICFIVLLPLELLPVSGLSEQ